MALSRTRIFEKLGFSDHEEKVYLCLLKNGSASIRQVAADTGVNRGTVYEALKQLVSKGQARLAQGLWVVIFPEGTRMRPHQQGKYQ